MSIIDDNEIIAATILIIFVYCFFVIVLYFLYNFLIF